MLRQSSNNPNLTRKDSYSLDRLEGFLWKQGQGLVRSYKRRWFSVDDGRRLYYYENREKSEAPRGFIELKDIESVRPLLSSAVDSVDPNVDLTRKSWDFCLHTPNRIYYLAADSEMDMYYWIQGIREIQLKLSVVRVSAERERRAKSASDDLKHSNVTKSLAQLEGELRSKSLVLDAINQTIQSNSSTLVTQASNSTEPTSSQQSPNSRQEKKVPLQKSLAGMAAQLICLKNDLRNLKEYVDSHILLIGKDLQAMATDWQEELYSYQKASMIKKLQQPSRKSQEIRPSTSYAPHRNHSQSSPNFSLHNTTEISVTTPPISPSLHSSIQSSNTTTSSSTVALWVPDIFESKCTDCHLSFSFVRRKHHCRSCGNIFCASCSNQVADVKGYPYKVRVCERCFIKLKLMLLTSR
eukprot:TRINITY_DN3778_c0_g1_i1.p1 TRINITY_DN3778_c0_g1~~TRINITY_DN3778_c0_g1_i1.p1  ORF type:complete len:410 (+),score=58.25 TRINITY_DN3778_c0_g1_i1:187-1416(+)